MERPQLKNTKNPKMKSVSKTTSVKSVSESEPSLKRNRTLSELDVSPSTLQLVPSNISFKSWKNEKEPTIQTLELRVEALEKLLQTKRELDKKPFVGGIKKIWGLIKKEGLNQGKVFTCLRDADGKNVAKSYKILEGALAEHADIKNGIKKLGAGKAKYWKGWFSKESDDLVLGTYSEEIVDDEPSSELIEEEM